LGNGAKGGEYRAESKSLKASHAYPIKFVKFTYQYSHFTQFITAGTYIYIYIYIYVMIKLYMHLCSRPIKGNCTRVELERERELRTHKTTSEALHGSRLLSRQRGVKDGGG
jgi:hypothetical protein